MNKFFIALFLFNLLGVFGQEDRFGKHIGELNSYHNQVGGDVYAVDGSTILIKDFTYDGNGKDTFFWAGSVPRPGPQGFLVPNEHGRTNLLGSYLRKDITIKLPDGKLIKDLRWLAVFDINTLESYGDVFIHEGFEPPQQTVIAKFASKTNEVTSGPVTIIDSKTIKISKFNYNGNDDQKEAYFYIGLGPTPKPKIGSKMPDEHGYMTPLHRYFDRTITLTLPGDKTVFSVDWLAVYDVKSDRVLGYVLIPAELNVPPSLVTVKEYRTKLPNCEQLYKDLQFSWIVNGDTITMELAAQIGEDDYASFGMSGDTTKPKMVGGDVVVAYREDYLPYIKDYNMTSYFPCSKAVRNYLGVCEDHKVAGSENYQPIISERVDGISVFSVRRRMSTADTGDIPFPEKGPATIIWALGKLYEKKRPAMHYAWSNALQQIDFGRLQTNKSCFAFTSTQKKPLKSWEKYQLTHINAPLNASIGPSGGPRGYEDIVGQTSPTGLAWYINGRLAPELVLKRDQEYEINVRGGSNPYDPVYYHPFIITDEPHGEYSQINEVQRASVRVLAGVETNAKGAPKRGRGSVGPLCVWRHFPHQDRRRDIDFTSFESFRNSLRYDCNLEEKPGRLRIKPDKSWPDVVYYNSWTGRNMGNKIYITDDGFRIHSSPLLLLGAFLFYYVM